jgi:hypothetical protein
MSERALDFSNDSFMWGLYTKYVYMHAAASAREAESKTIQFDDAKHLMTPGLFCQYFAVRWAQALKNGAPTTVETVTSVLDELAKPDCIFSRDPAGPGGCMDIYADAGGDAVSMYDWETY